MTVSDASRSRAADSQPTNRVWARLAFVAVVAMIGVLVSMFITSRMATTYAATARVGLPAGVEPSSFISDAQATSLTGDDGRRLDITVGETTLAFTGEASTPDVAAVTANQSAEAFIAAQNDPAILMTSPADIPTSPSSPRRGLAAVIGGGLGALIGLLLQSALKPGKRSESVAYIPAWTKHDPQVPLDQPAEPEPHDTQPPNASPPAMSSTPSAAKLDKDRASGSAAAAAGDDLFEPFTPGDEYPPVDVAAPGLVEAAAATSFLDLTADPGADTAAHTPDAIREPSPAHSNVDDSSLDESSLDGSDDLSSVAAESDDLSSPAPGSADPADPVDTADPVDSVDPAVPIDTADATDPVDSVEKNSHATTDGEEGNGSDSELRNLLARTGANIDPMVDRFADDDADDSFADELLATSESTSPGAFEASVGATETANTDQLVQHVTFLSTELTRYQQLVHDDRLAAQQRRDAMTEAHQRELEDLGEQLQSARLDLERLEHRRDSARAIVEDRVAELEIELAARDREIGRLREERQTDSGRHRAHEDDLEAENKFLRDEIDRYQKTIEEERVAHATVVAAAGVESQREIDRIHGDHRSTLNQLAHTNRNLLATQRTEADRALSAAEADHQRQLEAAHADYERRVQRLRDHFDDKIATSEARAVERHDSAKAAEAATALSELATSKAEIESLQQRLETAEATIDDLERGRSQHQFSLEQVERSATEERRRLTHRARTLEEQLDRAETRLSEERRRTSDVVRNLLEDSASSVAQAEKARRSEADLRTELEARHRAELEAAMAQTESIAKAAAEREAVLEATIAGLRSALDASTG